MNRLYPKLPPGYITKSTIIVVTSGTALYAVAELLLGNESFYRKTVMPMVHRFIDGESAHRLGVKLAKYSLFPPFSSSYCEYPELECDLLGMHLRNPVGLAAGFDKDAEAVHGLRKSGFGMIEVGTVTPLPQEGNPAPRVFRLTEDEGIINRYGFNSAGVGQVYARVRKAYEPKHPVPLGINIGKNKSTEDAYLDYNIGVNYFSQYCDYLVVNISSPNTPGLRSMQKRSELQKLMLSVTKAVDLNSTKLKRPKVFLKIAPDLVDSDKKDIAKIALDKQYGVDGLIVSNTTISRPDTLLSSFKAESGGLSGKPLKDLSTECIREMYKLTHGKVPIIGCGGISSGADAYEKIRAGASVVQLYTSLVYQGFPVIGRIKRELVELIRRDGYRNVSEAIGADHKV